MATTSTTTSAPQSAVNSGALYDALSELKERTEAAFIDFDNVGELTNLREELGYIRERAESIQAAVMGHIDAILTHL